tara:strand:- start:3962 stop:4441 length:480 start_codon:yes stop_codon:yes gene_type:complete
MKKLITLFIAFTLISCNDGDFDIPAFEFTNTVKSCGEYLLFVKNTESTEVLMLSLTNTQLGSTVGEKTYPISTTLKVTYRIFDEKITDTYFCQAIPPATPLVLKELLGIEGTLVINTIATITNEVVTGYEYDISLKNLLFLDNNQRIYFESMPFGTFKK